MTNAAQFLSWKVIIGNLSDRQLEVIKALNELGGEATAEMIALRLKRLTYVVSPRLTELLNKKLIVDSGRMAKNSTGRQATIWIFNDKFDWNFLNAQ